MYRRLASHCLVGLGLALSIGACIAPDLNQPCPVPPDVIEKLNTLPATDPAFVQAQADYQTALAKCFPAVTDVLVDASLKKNLDILFVIDNSTSMSPKQAVLAAAIPTFIQQIDATGANYHLGVVTTDIGTLPTGNPFPGAATDLRCGVKQFGDDGLLQNTPCTARNLSCNGVGCVKPSDDFKFACIGNAGPPAISALCPDPTFVPKDRFIAKDAGINNIGNGMDPTAPEKAFKCIGLVGDLGCGVEAPLEAAKRALDDHLPENLGFLRPDSVVAVIWITDEDDCSVNLGQRINLNPQAMSCATAGQTDSNFNCFNLDYRCMAKDLQCDAASSLNVQGQKTGCTERADTWLDPVDKYANFFAGLRSSDKLVLAGIWTPSLQDFYDRGSTGDGQLFVDTETAGDFSTNFLNRGKKDKAACFNAGIPVTDPNGFFGQAQFRLEAFRKKFDPAIFPEASICDNTNYPSVLNTIAAAIAKLLQVDCLSVNPTLDAAGNPLCQVGYVDANEPHGTPDALFPICSTGCCDAWANSTAPIQTDVNGVTIRDPAIVMACTPEPQDCYCAVQSNQGLCNKNNPPTPLAGVWIKDNMAPQMGKQVNFRCAGTRSVEPKL